jgi:penicillin-binding protein 1A
VVAGLVLSGFSELAQLVIPTRVPSLSDFALNALGALIGTLLAVRGARAAAGRSRLPGILARCVALVGVLALVGALGTAGLVLAVPSVADAPARVRVLAAAHSATLRAAPAPTRVAAALLATEDARYYSNPGVDPLGAARWIVGTVQGSPDAGGATIEQQLAKMLYTNGHQGTIDRVEQVGLALKLDRTYSKAQILRMYLNTAYFGHGYYGITAAAKGYFSRSADHLTWPQAALLAGLVQAPTAYDPVAHPDLATSRRAHVLDRLAATGSLSATQAALYSRSGLGLARG